VGGVEGVFQNMKDKESHLIILESQSQLDAKPAVSFLRADFLGQPRNGVAAQCQLRQLPFQLRGSEADKSCMRETPPHATTGCDKVLCTVATETSKYH